MIDTIKFLTIFVMGGLTVYLLILAIQLLITSSKVHAYRLATALSMLGWVGAIIIFFLGYSYDFAESSFLVYLSKIIDLMLIPLMCNIGYTLIRRSQSSYWPLFASEMPFLVVICFYGYLSVDNCVQFCTLYSGVYALFMVVWFFFQLGVYRRRLSNAYSDIDIHKLSSFRTQGFLLIAWAGLYSLDLLFRSPLTTLHYYCVSFVMWAIFYQTILRQRKVDMEMIEATEQTGNIWEELDVAPSTDEPQGSAQPLTVAEIKQKLRHCMEEEQLFLDPNLDVRMLANAVGTSIGTLISCLNHGLGKTFTAYVNDWRLVYMERQLRTNKEVDVKQLAAQCGFRTPDLARRQFKAKYGVSITKYHPNND